MISGPYKGRIINMRGDFTFPKYGFSVKMKQIRKFLQKLRRFKKTLEKKFETKSFSKIFMPERMLACRRNSLLFGGSFGDSD